MIVTSRLSLYETGMQLPPQGEKMSVPRSVAGQLLTPPQFRRRAAPAIP
jgi:hypothetical protein